MKGKRKGINLVKRVMAGMLGFILACSPLFGNAGAIREVFAAETVLHFSANGYTADQIGFAFTGPDGCSYRGDTNTLEDIYTTNGLDYVIPDGTDPTAEMSITITYDVGHLLHIAERDTLDTTKMSATSVDGIRTFTYTAEVQDMVGMTISLNNASFKTVSSGHYTVTAPERWAKEGTGYSCAYYVPLFALNNNTVVVQESFTMHIDAAEDYDLATIHLRDTSGRAIEYNAAVTEEYVDENVTYRPMTDVNSMDVTVDYATESINITTTHELLPAPTGSVSSTRSFAWLSGNNPLTYTKSDDEVTAGASYPQYAFVTTDSSSADVINTAISALSADDLDWQTFVDDGTGNNKGTGTLAIADTLAEGTYVTVVARRKETIAGETVYSPARGMLTYQFDKNGPQLVSADPNLISGSEVTWSTANSYTVRIRATDAVAGVKELYASTDQATLLTGQKRLFYDSGLVNVSISRDVKNGANVYYVRMYDKVGHYTTEQLTLQYLKFDAKAPTIQVTYEDADGNPLSDEDLANWQAGNIYANIQVTDTQGTKTADEISGLAENGYVTVNYAGSSVTPSNVSYDATTHTYTGRVRLDQNGIAQIKVNASDVAGNTATEYTKDIKIDKTGISDVEVKLSLPNSTTDDGPQFVSPFEVQVAATSISGIQSMRFDFYDSQDNLLTSSGDLTGAEVIHVSGETSTATYAVQGNQLNGKQGYVVVTCADKLGAASGGRHILASARKEFIYGTDGAVISLTGSEQWTNSDASCKVSVTSVVHPIRKVEYVVNGSVVKTVNPNTKIYTDTYKITENSGLSGTEVQVYAYIGKDEAHQVRTMASKILRVDKQAPSIVLTGVTAGGLYNTNKTLNVVTFENIYTDMEPIQVTATRTLDGDTATFDLGAISADGETTTAQKVFSEDGIYEVTAYTKDAAGNTTTEKIQFTIDKTAPAITLSGIDEGGYVNHNVNLGIQVVESFFENNRVTVQLARTLEGVKTERAITFNNTAKTSLLNHLVSEDGDYVLTVSAIDEAGNVATTQTLAFTVDVTAPEITLNGTKDYFVTSEPISLDFSVVESYYQTNTVRVTGTRKDVNGKVESVYIPNWVNSSRVSSLKHQFTEDGYYTVTINATDKAGNRQENTVHFTIDTQAPIIDDSKLQEYNGKYITSFRMDEKLEDLITELTVPTVTMTLNGVPYDGSEITEDGKYSLSIYVEDEVGLSTTKTIEFVIDSALPRVIFAGAEDGHTYLEAIHLNIALENENDKIEKILINGEPYTLIQGNTTYDLSFSEYGDYTIQVDTSDEVGNVNSQTIGFTYAEHRDIIWLIVLIGAGVGILGVLVALLIRSRRK